MQFHDHYLNTFYPLYPILSSVVLLKVAKMAEEMEAELEKESKIITEEVALNKHQIRMLIACKFPQKMMEEIKDLKLDHDKDHGKMRFTGLPNDIIASNRKMIELLLNLKSSVIEKSKDYIKVSVHVIVFSVIRHD